MTKRQTPAGAQPFPSRLVAFPALTEKLGFTKSRNVGLHPHAPSRRQPLTSCLTPPFPPARSPPSLRTAHPSRHGGRPLQTHTQPPVASGERGGQRPSDPPPPLALPLHSRRRRKDGGEGRSGAAAGPRVLPPPALREGAPAPHTVSPPRQGAAPPHAGMAEGLFCVPNTAVPSLPPALRGSRHFPQQETSSTSSQLPRRKLPG